jgi:hypothetical protein
MIQLILVVIFIVGGLFYASKMKRTRTATIGPAARAFLEQTGYRYADVADPNLDAHVARYEASWATMSKGFQSRMVRNFQGVAVHHVQEGKVTDRGWSSSCAWMAPLPQRPRVRLHLADKSLSGVGKVVKEAFSNRSQSWQPLYSVKVELADAELAKRFVCYSDGAGDAQTVLHAPGLRERLLSCVEVDLVITDADVRFSDPFQKNLLAAMGGAAGAVAARGDIGKTLQAQIPMHDRISEMLVIASRAAM